MPVGYKFSEEECQPGELVIARADHLPGLSADKQRAELAIRRGDPRGPLRGHAVFAFAERRVAEDLLGKVDGQHLYEMAIEEEDILHRGDLRIYDEIVERLKAGDAVDELVAEFWEGRCRPRPRVELCVMSMRARCKLA